MKTPQQQGQELLEKAGKLRASAYLNRATNSRNAKVGRMTIGRADAMEVKARGLMPTPVETPTTTIPKEHKKALSAVSFLTKESIYHTVTVTKTEDETKVEIYVKRDPAHRHAVWDHSFTQLFFTRSNWAKRVLGGGRRTHEKVFAYEYDGVKKSGQVTVDDAYRMIVIRYTDR